ncbi:MAG: PPC domain-containing protein [Leptolyngbya sp. SIO1E4]|nr:PPC domain-containing protein [Leptolyngbya sp. SIO1E4]
MALNKKLTSSLMSLVLAIGGSPFFPTPTALASSEQLAQVTPNTVTGRLDRSSQVHWDGSYYNIHTFEGQAGETVRIDMVSNDFDAYLILFGPQGGRVTQNDDGGSGSNATIIATLPATGNYQIAANAYRAGETGQYTVTWRPATSQELNSRPPASVADIITEAISRCP